MTVEAAGRMFPIEIARHRRARRYLLRVTPAGTLRLTVPRGGTIAGGVAFAKGQTAWIAREWLREQHRSRPWDDRTPVWYRGTRIPLVVRPLWVTLADREIPRRNVHDEVRSLIEADLRSIAERELAARCHVLAAACGLKVARVSVRNQQSRWGACSSRGAITLNWRLVQMPPHVSDYVIFHELMHLRQPNHSRRFWREVAAVCPDWRDGERWLRAFGTELL